MSNAGYVNIGLGFGFRGLWCYSVIHIDKYMATYTKRPRRL